MRDISRAAFVFLACGFCVFAACPSHAADAAQDVDAVAVGGITEEPLFSFDSAIGPIEYRAGRGLRFDSIGLNIGGYTALEYEYERTAEEHIVELEGLNFLILWEPLDWFRTFAEFEIGPLLVYETSVGEARSDVEFEIERLYADLTAGDPLTFRFGKFQTPVGRWNLVPAEPFTWTASEPVFIERAFPEQQTGAAFVGSLYPNDDVLDYWLYSQFLDPLQPGVPSVERLPDEKTIGARLQYTGAYDRWSVGSSFLASELDDRWNFLGGVDAELNFGPLELTSEFEIVRGDIPDRNVWDIYLQGVLSVGRGVYLVARYEHFDPSGPERSVDLGDLGIAWVPVPFLRLKVDYRIPNRETDSVVEGLSTSLSLVF